jgi:hypothetical protein
MDSLTPSSKGGSSWLGQDTGAVRTIEGDVFKNAGLDGKGEFTYSYKRNPNRDAGRFI